MLILTRKPSETIRIGDDIILTVLGVSGQQTRLGIAAPAGIAVHRQEIYERIQAEAVAVGQAEQTTDKPAGAESMHIDDRVRMAANARRYEWLRDAARVDDAEDEVVAGRGIHCFYGEDLDREIDDAMRLAHLEELHPCAG